MRSFIKSTLMGSGTGISSKRVIMFLLLAIFAGEFLAWYFLKIPPNAVLDEQLFTFLLAALGTIFGEPLMDAIKLNAQKKVDDSNKDL